MKELYRSRSVLGDWKSREEVMYEIRKNPDVYMVFQNLNRDFQERYIQFCMGVRGVMMTYDPFFKHIFDVEKHPERLSDFVSCIVKKKLQVKHVLPSEHRRISEKGSLLVMDILAETESGELVNVEIQKIGYLFPGQRASCYAADMIMRQYEREKSNRGEKFTYKDMKKVYTIVIIEKSGKEFKKHPNHYVHGGTWKFSTGLELDMLEEFYYVPLDIFFDIEDNKIEETKMSELAAWLYFIGSDQLRHIQKVVERYPKFEEMYREIVRFRYHPEEAIGMFSEALKVLDENTVTYMVEEMKQELEEKDKKLEEKNKKLLEKERALEESRHEIERLKELLQAEK